MTEDRSALSNQAAGSQSVAAAPVQPSTNPVSRFVEWIKPYKELATIGGGIVVLLSGSVSWAVSRFATVEQLSSLECRMSINITIQALPIQSSMLSMKIEGKWAQIAGLSRDNSPENQTKIAQLREDLKDFSDERKKIDNQFQQEISSAPVKCASRK